MPDPSPADAEHHPAQPPPTPGATAGTTAGATAAADPPPAGLAWRDLLPLLAGPDQERTPLRQLPRLAREALGLVWAAAPRELVASVVLKALGGAGLGAVLLLGRDVLAGILSADRLGASSAQVLPRLALLTAVIAILGISAAIGRELSSVLGELAGRHARGKLIDVASAVELDAYETPAFHDRLSRATRGGQYRPVQLVSGLLGLVGAAVGTLSVAAALLAIQPWLLPLSLVAALPVLAAAAMAGDVLFKFHCRQTHAERQRNYLYRLLTEKDAAAEVRAFGLAAFLRGRYERLYDIYLAEHRATARRRLRLQVAGTMGMAIVLTGTVAVLLWLALSGRLSLAEAGTAAAAMLVLGERLTTGAMEAGGLYETARFLQDYTAFVALHPAIGDRRPRDPAPPAFTRLTAENITFTYPSGDRPALRDVSIRIGAGEVVALVGENGSGKTTLAKLLCRLYLPTTGRIRWDGVDAAGIDPDALRGRVAVIFQDFLHYALPARDNIALGRHQRAGDHDAIVAAACHAGAHEFLDRLPSGYDTVLGTEFKAGKDLSIGQWQRVALARAFFRDAPFVILDEPTAALDARAEHNLFAQIRTLYQGRSVLLISHRFSSVRTADRIYVLRHGRVIEHGTHEALMARGGHYAELFTLQAAAYLDPEPAPSPQPTTYDHQHG
jgi:ATP-binding cassette, subfamily B, bacterial